jgi:hypothetical protein
MARKNFVGIDIIVHFVSQFYVLLELISDNIKGKYIELPNENIEI